MNNVFKKIRKYKYFFPIIFILAIASFLRIYKIGSNYYFSGELGKELLYLGKYAEASALPLIGMATSHEWLNYGPIYYWIVFPLYAVFKGNPFILFWVAFTVSIFGLTLNYFVVNKIAGKGIAIYSTLIQSFSPLFIWQTRLSKLHVFFFLIMPVFMFALSKLWNGNKKWLFWTGLIYGTLFSFHFSQIPLIGVLILLFWIKKNIYTAKDWLLCFFGIILPNITYIFKDLIIVAWVPYRIVSPIDKNPLNTLLLLNEYLGKNIFWDSRLWTVGSILFLVTFAHYFYKNRKVIKKDFLHFYLITSILVVFFANILHGSPPVHYFLPIFTTLPVLFSVYLYKTKSALHLLVLITIINLFAFWKSPYFYLDFTSNHADKNLVKYETQIAAAKFIVNNSHGSDVLIKRIGPFDYFPENYSQNYKYLVKWLGGKPVDSSENTYTIIENDSGINVQKF